MTTASEVLLMVAEANDTSEQHRQNIHGHHQGRVSPHDLERGQAAMVYARARVREIPSDHLRTLAAAPIPAQAKALAMADEWKIAAAAIEFDDNGNDGYAAALESCADSLCDLFGQVGGVL